VSPPGTDWVAWHRQYEAEGPLSRRLATVQAHIDRILDRGRSPFRVLSLCSGDGRDLIGPVARHAPSMRVEGRLVELDPLLAAGARASIAAAGLDGLDVREVDAGAASAADGAVPADLVLLCGIFGNVSDADIQRTIRAAPMLCAPGARVIWTRHRREPDLTPAIRRWFEESGFEHEAFDAISDSTGSVGVERLVGSIEEFDPGLRLFSFRETTGNWRDDLEVSAPDVVAAFRGIEEGRFISVRREVRRRTSTGSAPAIVAQLAAVAGAFDILLAQLPDRAFREPGGEGDWNVAEAIGHTAHARAGLALAAALAASDRWPVGAPPVVPGVPGAAAASREELRRRVAMSQRSIERASRAIAGHETDPCPLEHPLVGRLRCGEWLLFAGIHDLMHLEQLHAIAAGPRVVASPT
jgi:hypothetical protein